VARYSVRSYGAVADGVTDDRAAFLAAFAAADAAGGGEVFVPGGHYATSQFDLSGVDRVCFRGEGMDASVIKSKRESGSAALMNWNYSVDNQMTALGFDMNAVVAFGGLNMLSVRRIDVNNCRFFDSAPVPDNGKDKYGFVVRHRDVLTDPVNKKVTFAGNVVEGVQTEFGDIQGLRVLRNTITNGRETVGVSVTCLGSDRFYDDLYFCDNDVTCDDAGGILVNIDVENVARNSFKNVVIKGNRITITAPGRRGIGVGSSKTVTGAGNVWEGLTVSGNRVYMRGTSGVGEGISVRPGNDLALRFRTVDFSGNLVEHSAGSTEWAVWLANLVNATVHRNVVKTAKQGLTLSDPAGVDVRANSAQGTTFAYQLLNSSGGNVALGNRSPGAAQGWLYGGNAPHATDSIAA
jgi:hypothetical protein